MKYFGDATTCSSLELLRRVGAKWSYCFVVLGEGGSYTSQLVPWSDEALGLELGLREGQELRLEARYKRG